MIFTHAGFAWRPAWMKPDKEWTTMANRSPEERKKYVDLDAGLGRVRGNKKIFKRMLGLYLNSA